MQQNISHFHFEITLPETAKTSQYVSSSKQGECNQINLEKFIYYHHENDIIKVLFLNKSQLIHQGTYPFTQPNGKIYSIEAFNNLKKVRVTEAAYIGHYQHNQQTQIVVKKMIGVKLDPESAEIQTIDDNFEIIPITNESRFSQFLKMMKYNKNAINISIRVMIQEPQNLSQKSKIIDFQFFLRQEQLKKNKNYQI